MTYIHDSGLQFVNVQCLIRKSIKSFTLNNLKAVIINYNVWHRCRWSRKGPLEFWRGLLGGHICQEIIVDIGLLCPDRSDEPISGNVKFIA